MSYKYFVIGGLVGLLVALTIYFIITLYFPVSDTFCFILGVVCGFIGTMIGGSYDR